ncbi:hypothetical protein DEU56DRAFT_919982 [Suillus clintonianus]|uniref:uncharacterized protein n=1 Tax=Suillus clintonianus TaxID=1904413 RepID=UPI001B8675D4|nr:uncharacterized protein DEU56DRAFT_919982 [Suillus clintonianus]KAG2111477.1 hypothetical protein DEU56DRAFT_919982 [Suillus clintonianus]
MAKHIRIDHVKSICIDGVTLTRQSDGDFHCHVCKAVYEDPLQLQTHHKRTHVDGVLVSDTTSHDSDSNTHAPSKRKHDQTGDINEQPQAASRTGGIPAEIPPGSGTPPRVPTPQLAHCNDTPSPKVHKKRKTKKGSIEVDKEVDVVSRAGSPPDRPSSSKKRKHKEKKAKKAKHRSAPDAQEQLDLGAPASAATTIPPLPSPSQADVAVLNKLSIIVDPIHKIAICIDCEIAIPADHVRTHAVSHDLRPPPQEVLQPILASLGCVNKFTAPLGRIPPIVGLKILRGSSCSIDGCGFLAVATRTMQDHFASKHPGFSYRPNSAERDLQRIYEFRGNQTLVAIDLNLIMPPQQRAFNEYLDEITRNVPHVDSDVYHVDHDTRQHGTFLGKMGWNKAIEGLSVTKALQVVSSPSDDEQHFQALHTAVHDWLSEICIVLPNIDVTFLRWVNTSKGEIVNAPFRAPVTDTYVAKCARIWARFLTMLLRFTDAPDSCPFELLLTATQTTALQQLLAVLTGALRGPVTHHIQEVSFLFLSTPNEHITQDRFSCNLIRYMIMSHLLLDGTFEPASTIVPNLSCIQYSMRATGVFEGYNRVLNGTTDGLLNFYFETLKPMLTEGERYPFTTLREEMHLLSSIAHSETRLPCLLWNTERTVLQVDGSPLIISAIRDMVHSLISRANTLIVSLCEGVDMKDFDQCLKTHLDPLEPGKWPKDPLRNNTPGYSFIQDPQNPFKAFQALLLQRFYDTPEIFNKYHVRQPSRTVFKQASVARWFNALAEFHDIVFCLVHVTSGGPARGTELETYRLTNTREGPRTLYFVAGHITFITGYNKSRQRTDYPDKYVARPIYRPLQPIIMYLAGPLRGIAEVWIHAIHTPPRDLGPQVFMRFSKPLRSEDFSQILQTQTNHHLHVSMGLRMWRQMIKAIMRRILNLDIDDEGDQQDDAIDESFGHSTGTGRSRYGLTWNDLPSLHEDMISELFQVSQRFWTWLDNPKRAAREPQISYTTLHEMASATLDKLQAVAVEQTVVIKETASNNKLIIDLLQSTHEKIDRTHQAVIQTQARSGDVSQSPVLDVGPMEIAFVRTQGLRAYLADPTANFKSIQQALAVEVISQGYPHVLIIMPTGAGKSVIYGSPGYVENAGFRLIVIPYRALLDQVIDDANSKGLAYAIYPSRDINLFICRLVFVSLERCADSEFRTWVKACKASGHLRGIIFDEAQDILIAAIYRHAFKMLLRITDLNVQVALLTGSLSPRSEVALLQMLRMEPSHVRKIRMPTHRPEIQYRVRRTTKETIDDDVVSLALSFKLQPHERGIIFVLTTNCCEQLAETTGFPCYHGQLSDEQRKSAMMTWRTGKSAWIVGTLAMAQGIDVHSVRIIVNREISWVSTDQQGNKEDKILSMIHFAQMSGRAGRDGKPSVHHLLYSNIPSVDINPSEDHAGLQSMVDLVSHQTCRRRSISLFLDGIDQTCLSMLSTELCDVCQSHAHVVRHHQQFYSSPSGSRLKSLAPPQALTPAHTLTQAAGPRVHGLPTPISRHTASTSHRQTSPTPFRQAGDVRLPQMSNDIEETTSSHDSDASPAPKATHYIPYGSRANQPAPAKRVHLTTHDRPPPQPAYVAPRAQGPIRSGSHHTQVPQPPSNSTPEDPFVHEPLLGEGYPTTRSGKEQHIGRWCQMNVGKCSICLFFSDFGRHFPYSCHRGILKTQGYKQYRQQLRFTSNGFCYGCLAPDPVHQNQAQPNPKSKFSCLYDDQLRPLAYVIYDDKPIFKAVCRAMGINSRKFLNRDAYHKWLGQYEPHPEALPNIHELLVHYMNLKLLDQLPAAQS